MILRIWGESLFSIDVILEACSKCIYFVAMKEMPKDETDIWKREEGKAEKMSEKQSFCVNLYLWFKLP